MRLSRAAVPSAPAPAEEAPAFPTFMHLADEEEQHVNEAGEACERGPNQRCDGDGEQAYGAHRGVFDDGASREELFCCVEAEGDSLSPGVEVESGEEGVDRGEAGTVKQHELAHLLIGAKGAGVTTEPSCGDDGEEKLERIDVEEDDKEQERIDCDRAEVMKTVTAEELVM